MKHLLSIGMFSIAMSASVSANTDLLALNQELEIMSNILKTSLQQKGNDIGRVRTIKSRYLAKQGVVFEVNVASAFKRLEIGHHQDFSVSMPEAPPIPDLISDGWEIDEHEIEMMVEHAEEYAREIEHSVRDKMRELRDRQRDASWQQRDLTRQIRDIEFALSSADKGQKKELGKQLTSAQKQLAEVQQKQDKMKQKAKEVKKAQKEQRAAREKAQLKAKQSFLQRFESKVSQVLCRYGAGLDALPKAEHITFVLPDLNLTESRRDKQDQIYVFNQNDVQSCVKGNIKSPTLLKKADKYSF